MLQGESYILVQLLGPQDPQIQSLVFAARDPKMQDAVLNMLRGLVRQRGINLDNLPAFALPEGEGLSPSDYPLGRAKCGEALGQEVGLSQQDIDAGGGIGVFGLSGTGKSTLVKIFILRFLGRSI